jgi:hypothetical protein
MPNRLLLEVGNKSVEIPLGGTPTAILGIMRRYAHTANLLVPETSTPEVLATAILEDLRRRVVEGAKQAQVNQQIAAIHQAAETDNRL